MIIDTNGFEIGDEVWCVVLILVNEAVPSYFNIGGFKYYKNKFILISEYQVECDASKVYHTKQECQLECDLFNGINND